MIAATLRRAWSHHRADLFVIPVLMLAFVGVWGLFAWSLS